MAPLPHEGGAAVRPALPRYLQRSVPREALKAQWGAGAGPGKRASPHCLVVASGEAMIIVPLRGMRPGDSA